MFSACGGGDSKKVSEVPSAAMKAAELNRKGEAAYAKGDYELSYRYYREALRISRSIEDFPSIARNVVNTAAALRALGRPDDARSLLEGLVATEHIDIPAETGSEARYLLGLLVLDAGRVDEALSQTENALADCGSSCPAFGRIHILRARVFLEKGETSTVLENASRGLSWSRKRGELREEANALRVMAHAHEYDGAYDEALRLYNDALAIDKAQALGLKVYHDLMGLARVTKAQGLRGRAVEYYQRAYSVAQGLGRWAAATEALEGLRVLDVAPALENND
jgi:tetratricopeptide (TPR) repeat protein